MAADEKSRGRGRPRDPSHDQAIQKATQELLLEEGYQGLTMAAVARRAGVAKTTIYRRWPTKADMVLEAIAEELEPEGPPSTGEAIKDLEELLVRFYRRLEDHAALLREPDVADVFQERYLRPLREHARALVERAIESGELRGDLDPSDLVDALIAPAIYYPVALERSGGPDLARRVFDITLTGARTD